MFIFLVTMINPSDPSYFCEYTVEAADSSAAKSFAEQQNPGLICSNQIRQ